MTNNIPSAINQIFEIFQKHQIYLVGGCVRDQILGRKIKDWDFSTDATPEKSMELLSNHGIVVVPTGIDYGTITAVIDGCNYEITTFRQDVETDGRKAVTKFSNDLILDSYRRDLTINALYMDADGKVLDFHQGLEDLNQKKLRFVGDAEQRIKEDYLRILRFFRFQNSLEFEGESNDQQCCLHYSNKILQYVAIERIWTELSKIFHNPNKKIFNQLQNCHQVEDFFQSLGWTFRNKPIILKKLPDNGHIYNMQACFSQDNLPEIFRVSKLERQLYHLYWNLYSQSGTLIDKILNLILIQNTNVDKKYFQQLINNSPHLNNVFESYAYRQFPVRGQDLADLGHKGHDIGNLYKKLKNIWFDHGCVLSKNQLLLLIDK